MAKLTDLKSTCFDRAERPFETGFLSKAPGDRKVIHIAGLGDVGRIMAIGLMLEGGDVVERIGLYDLSEVQCERMAVELGQISYPCGGKRLPDIVSLAAPASGGEDAGTPGQTSRPAPAMPADLFDCDVFLFSATKAVPEVGSGVGDVRMAQYEANRGIVGLYAKKATEAGFKGLFGVVSDPVELLCRSALTTSEEYANANGLTPLSPGQIQGFGMGVMFARAAYFARRLSGDHSGNSFPEEGRVFGQHGQELIVANSTLSDRYDDDLSKQLTALTVSANKEVRALGFKPFIAPALSSAALTILEVIRGGWTDSSIFLNGLYFGVRNRVTETGRQIDPASLGDLPDSLTERITHAYMTIDEMAAR